MQLCIYLLNSNQSISVTAAGFNGADSFTGGQGTDSVTYADAYSVSNMSFVGSGSAQTLRVSTSADGTDTLKDVEVLEFASGVTVRVVGAGGYATIADAVSAADSGDTLLLAAAAPVSIATANTIASKSLAISNATLTEISDTATNISNANFASSALNGYTTITNTTSGTAATLTAAELGNRAVTLSGDGTFQVTGSLSELLALDSAVYSNTDTLVLSDTAQNITGLTTTQIANLISRGIDEVSINLAFL